MTPYPARLFRIELKRNVTWPLLPVLADLLWVASPYGRTLKEPVALWSSRSVAMQGTLQVLGPFAAAVAGILVAAAGAGLAATGRDQAPVGPVVPALNDAAAARPVSYVPACDHAAPVPLCVHPAYRSLLPAMAADLAPLTREVAGLPGASARVEMAAPGGPELLRRRWLAARLPALRAGRITLADLP